MHHQVAVHPAEALHRSAVTEDERKCAGNEALPAVLSWLPRLERERRRRMRELEAARRDAARILRVVRNTPERNRDAEVGDREGVRREARIEDVDALPVDVDRPASGSSRLSPER